MASSRSKERVSTSELSKVPSWILLGFAIGGLFVFLLRREYVDSETQPPATTVGTAEPVAVVATASSVTERKGEPSLSSIEAVWAVWGIHAIWDGDLTQVALWNTAIAEFSDCFEVTRRSDQVYFRSIAHLSHPVIDRGLGKHSPLQFTSPAPAAPRR